MLKSHCPRSLVTRAELVPRLPGAERERPGSQLPFEQAGRAEVAATGHGQGLSHMVSLRLGSAPLPLLASGMGPCPPSPLFCELGLKLSFFYPIP